MKKSSNLLTDVELLYANDALIAVHKKPGIPCQSRNTQSPVSLENSLEKYLNESVRLWTRIDQPVGGIVLFFRDKPDYNPADFEISDKTYLGIVEGHPLENNSTIVSYIRRDGRRMKAREDHKKGKKAELSWKVIKSFDHYTLLEIKPKTGRFHQIRYQMAQMGHPLKGDVKYGARRKNDDRSIHLHGMEYVILPQNGEALKIRDYSLPNDPLWNQAKENIFQPPQPSQP